MQKLVIIRHGTSVWNIKNIFTGWIDIKLSKKGIKEAKKAGKLFNKYKFNFDITYTSFLKRAIHTAWYILCKLNLIWTPIIKTWKLNERHYGALQGKNKNEILLKYGEKQFIKWRRSYTTKPPLIKKIDKNYTENEFKYKNLISIPLGESLLDTYNRVIPYWKKIIYKNILKNKCILIVAHGNSLRALIKYIEQISDNNIIKHEIPTATPYIYEYNIPNIYYKNNYLINIKKKYYLK